MAAGLADDLATTLLLATDKRVLVAPAMNVRMWLHPATQRNVERLEADGVLFVGPDAGAMACGEFGPGRMAEPPCDRRGDRAGADSAPRRPITSESASRPAQGTARRRHFRPDLRADRPCPLPGKPLVRPSRACNCAIRCWRRRKSDVGDRAGRSARSGRRNSDSCRVGAGNAGGGRGGAAGRRLHRRGRGRRLAAWTTSRATRSRRTSMGAPTLRLVENPDILAEISKKTPSRPAFVIGFAAETEDVTRECEAQTEAQRLRPDRRQ